MNHVCSNGKFLPAGQPVLTADNRSYRYGDGLFETLKVIRNRICLADYHFQRFFEGLQLLEFDTPPHFSPSRLAGEILHLCEKNRCAELARIRLSASRGQGGLYEFNPGFDYIIEAWQASPTVNELNTNGLIIGVFTDALKSSDRFSHLKSSAFLPYVMASKYARDRQLNDCLVLNQHGRIADASIANIFLVKNNTLFTPPLGEGCIAGVMRRYLLEQCNAHGYPVSEQPIAEADLLQADEVFLTNAMQGLRWVKQYRNKTWTNRQTVEIYERFIKTIWL